MNPYIHHIPGRIRVRVAAVKACARTARGIRSQLRATPGVQSVEVNTLTGSVLILYNPHECDGQRLLSSLGVRNNRPQPPTSAIADKVIHAVASSLFELAVQKATLALVAAVL